MDAEPGKNAEAAELEFSTWWRSLNVHYLVAAVGLVAGAVAVAWVGDQRLAATVDIDGLPGDLRRVIHLSEIFGHGYGVALMLLATWILAPTARRHFPRLLMMAILPGVSVQLIKLFVMRFRPAAGMANQTDEAFDTALRWAADSWNVEYLTQSFPSGHTASAFGMALGLAWLFPRGKWFFLFLATMAGLQRIADNAHWPSDVMVGAAIALVFAFCVLPKRAPRGS